MNRRPAVIGALLAALTLGCAACTSTAASSHTPPASSPESSTHNTVGSSETPISSVSTTPGGTTGSSTPSSRTPSSSTPAKTGTPPAGTVAADWASHVNFTAVAHPDMGCADAGEGNKVEVTKVVSADVTGDGVSEAIVRMDCLHAASEWPDWVFVYSDATGTPKVLGTLISNTDSTYVTTLATSGHVITLGLLTWSNYAAGCCADLHYSQSFTWNGSSFARSARRDVLTACGDTAFTVTATEPDSATGHSGIVLEFRNRLPEACTIHGYPGLDAMSSAGHVLAHATRTLNGFTGGAHSVPTLTVAPGHTVSARVEWLNFNPATSGSCTTPASIEVTPANTSDTVSLPVRVTVCGLEVHPTVAGTSGNA